MCNPAFIMVGLAVASSVQGAQAADKEATYQQGVAENNAMTQRWMAQDRLDQGVKEEADHRLEMGQLEGRQKAQIAGSGRDFSGSAAGLIDDAEILGNLDALKIRENASRDAYLHDVNAHNFDQQAVLTRQAGDDAVQGSLLSGAGNVASSWYGASGNNATKRKTTTTKSTAGQSYIDF